MIYTTPIGEVIYSNLVEPSTKFDNDGVYDVTIALTEEDAKPLIECIDDAIEQNMQELAKQGKKRVKQAEPPYKPEYDSNDMETGRLLFKFKQKAHCKSKDGREFSFTIPIYDCEKHPFRPKSIGRGTQLIVAFETNGYYTAMLGAGVTLRLKGVQIVQLEEFDTLGNVFGTIDNGYVADTTEEASDNDGVIGAESLSMPDGMDETDF